MISSSFYLGQIASLMPDFGFKGHFGPFRGSGRFKGWIRGVGGPMAMLPKIQVLRVQVIRSKWTWLGILDSPRKQSDSN